MTQTTAGTITIDGASSKWYEGICSSCGNVIMGSKPGNCPSCRSPFDELRCSVEPETVFDVVWDVGYIKGEFPGVVEGDILAFEASETEVIVRTADRGEVARWSPLTSFQVTRFGTDRGAGSWHLSHKGKLLAVISPTVLPPPVTDVPAHPAVVVWSYPGRTQADAASDFARHASELASEGYSPTAQSWAEGRPGVGRVLALGALGASAIRPKGFLTVTYQLRIEIPPVQATARNDDPKPVDPIDQIRRLGELRDAGLITEDEYLAKKAEMLGRL